MASKVPDLEWGPWSSEYASDCYFNLETGKGEYIRLSLDMTEAQHRKRERLAHFWFARAFRYLHDNGEIGCLFFNVFDRFPAIMMWGMLGDEDSWVSAVMLKGNWYILKPHETWEFNFDLSEDELALTKVSLFLNSQKIAEY